MYKEVKMNIFDVAESKVRSYSRLFPCIFDKSKDEILFDCEGNKYIDFLAGAGSLNYGHNHSVFKDALIKYINDDGIIHSLDFHTQAKKDFLETFCNKILRPRNMDYVIQFTGPTGANSVEAALKLARKIKGRSNIIAFTNGFHGVTIGALAATGNSFHRDVSGITLSGVTRMPYDGYLGEDIDTLRYLDKTLSDKSSGVDKPAAVIVETVQGEGGLNTCSAEWLLGLEQICHKHDMLMIIDDIQAGCGRMGTFFSFEDVGLQPDIITLSKSISGNGLPMALTLFKPEIDSWEPGEHNGTFRGNNLAFITAKIAIDHFWSDDVFTSTVKCKSELVLKRLSEILVKVDNPGFKVRGRGMMCGIDCVTGLRAMKVTRKCFEKGLIIETCGPDNQIAKILCPLTISNENLTLGLDVIEQSILEVVREENFSIKEN